MYLVLYSTVLLILKIRPKTNVIRALLTAHYAYIFLVSWETAHRLLFMLTLLIITCNLLFPFFSFTTPVLPLVLLSI